MAPRPEQLPLPVGYGNPSKILSWEEVTKKLAMAWVYWLASTRRDGRPHVVPRDGIWLDDRLYYGGSPETVHHRNVQNNRAALAHIGDGHEAIIVEGEVISTIPSSSIAQSLAKASFDKYPQYGRVDPSAYETGILVLEPRKVIAWTQLPIDATRFIFELSDARHRSVKT